MRKHRGCNGVGLLPCLHPQQNCDVRRAAWLAKAAAAALRRRRTWVSAGAARSSNVRLKVLTHAKNDVHPLSALPGAALSYCQAEARAAVVF